ncbi:A-type flagellin [Psychromonas sp. CNPT3]|uniref:flagellin N-terminal helical domain-containing protein n=1 Tax=Psychromonas sp. CNPT3 TaxID=314282 RepID=UPI00006E3490|nr:flagellin [Psychromonas sp. CNPT3]AGH80577.1 A-type flagellin [Psychromonas sp. CNPT3]
MPQVINTNIMSLNAQRQLNKSQLLSNEAMERLSSGLRINSAKDDAAGLAISTGMQSQIRGINQAVRNANDGISMSQTAEGSMDEMTNILQRMRELSVQAANDTNSASNKESIQKEIDQLYEELDRIANTTQFNGTNLLDGSNKSTTLQIGANAGENLTFGIDAVTTADLGLNGGVNKGDLNSGRVIDGNAAIPAGKVSINGIDLPEIGDTDGGQAVAMVKAVNIQTALTGVTAKGYNVVEGQSFDGINVTGITNGLTIQVGDGANITLGATSSMENLAETINRDVKGVTANVGKDGRLILNNDTGFAITVGGNVTNSGLEAATFEGYMGLTSQDGGPIEVGVGTTGTIGDNTDTKKFGFMITNGSSVLTDAPGAGELLDADKITINGVELIDTSATTIDDKMVAINKLTDATGVTATASIPAGSMILTAKDGSDIVIASGAATEADKIAALAKLGINDVGGSAVTELGLSVRTSKKASESLGRIDIALSKISESRAGLGAIQNRLGSTISNLENVSQNLSASNSRIQDADFAAETAKMSKAQILQQAGTSMLAQANASTQSVLKLLQG